MGKPCVIIKKLVDFVLNVARPINLIINSAEIAVQNVRGDLRGDIDE